MTVKTKLVADMDGCLYKGAPCHIQAIKTRGWVLIIDNTGKARNVLAKDITVPSAEPPPADVVGDTPKVEQENKTMASKKTPTRNIVDSKVDLSKYERVKGKDGKTTFDTGDDVAVKLRGMDLAEVYEFAATKLDVSVRSLKEKYGHLNAGQQRMNLGNRIRGAFSAKAKAKAKAAKAA